MKVYVTKYALTKGILEKEVEATHAPQMVAVPGYGNETYHLPFWHLTREEATAHAEQLRKRKLASLRKSMLYLENLSF